MVQCKIRTECGREEAVIWEEVKESIFSLDNPERGTSNREGAFVTIWFEQNGTDNEFMQCMPFYPKPTGFFKRLFGLSKETNVGISSYIVEVGTGEKIYATQVNSKEQIAQIFHEYYLSRKLPDTTNWEDTGII
ncbi:hypothetical protein [Fusobacterium sp.]|uniref:hypothetical protein n=1 Tax=Fusobacterium sp. TaxID=68766 RepID=UPI002901F76A|nr:hypothetical protein [Fusobacterium sp.]MDU1911039.1 hypothetical protein [Fusobacterium sp.]